MKCALSSVRVAEAFVRCPRRTLRVSSSAVAEAGGLNPFVDPGESQNFMAKAEAGFDKEQARQHVARR
jgi:hypothetical protein